jgi:hypothetical protein
VGQRELTKMRTCMKAECVKTASYLYGVDVTRWFVCETFTGTSKALTALSKSWYGRVGAFKIGT